MISKITSPLLAFELTVICLEKLPILLESYLTVILPCSPGFTGSLVHLGTVQPQLLRTFDKIRDKYLKGQKEEFEKATGMKFFF